MKNHVIYFGEPGRRGWTFEHRTDHPEPARLAKRAMRMINFWNNKPGGYDQVLSRAQVFIHKDDGRCEMKVVRAGRSHVRNARKRQGKRCTHSAHAV